MKENGNKLTNRIINSNTKYIFHIFRNSFSSIKEET